VQNYANDTSGDLSAIGTDAGSLAADTSAALNDPPPDCVPGMTGDYQQAMRDLNSAATTFIQAAGSQDIAGVTAATSELNRGNNYLGKADTDLTNYESSS
jgi:hypothetical protein